jgi:hypothetical protein
MIVSNFESFLLVIIDHVAFKRRQLKIFYYDIPAAAYFLQRSYIVCASVYRSRAM